MPHSKKSSTFLIVFVVTCCTGAIIDPDLVESLNSNRRTKVLIYFANGNTQVLNAIREQSFSNRSSKVTHLTKQLQTLSNALHSPIQEYLSTWNIQSHSYWVSNQMIVENVNSALVQRLSLFPQVNRIRKVPEAKLHDYKVSNDSIPWGVAKIQSNRVWDKYGVTGERVVVANIDTGVRWSHQSLRHNWREEHGWFDPYFNTTIPNDENGHGTHTMGTIAGARGIGVAPGVKWIACRGCANDRCDAAELLSCGQWMLSPENPDLIPDIISNSWGNPGGNDDWYNGTINAWKEAGILHVFAIGNSGPFCRSASSPGDQQGVLGVGSIDEKDQLSMFSSKGPVKFFESEYIKPDISAPGSDIYSAWATGDTVYKTISGTSMATPHVAGVIALMVSARRLLNPKNTTKMEMDEVVKIIEKSSDRNGLTVSFPNSRCGNGQEVKWPNNEFGYGKVNAYDAVRKTLKYSKDN